MRTMSSSTNTAGPNGGRGDPPGGNSGGGVREQQKRDRRRRIFQAAMTLFGERGFHDTTFEQIADAAGVSRGTVFNYFPYKEALLTAAFAEELADLRERLPAEPEAPLATLYRIFDELAAFVEANRPLVLPLSYELLNPDPERSRAALRSLPLTEVLRHYLAQARERGELRSGHSLERLARTIANTYFLTALQWAAYRPDRAIREELRIALELTLQGIAASAPPPASGHGANDADARREAR